MFEAGGTLRSNEMRAESFLREEVFEVPHETEGEMYFLFCYIFLSTCTHTHTHGLNQWLKEIFFQPTQLLMIKY